MTHIHRVSRSHRRRVLIPRDDRWFDNDGQIAGCWAAWQPRGALNQEHSYTDVSGHLHSAVPAVEPAWTRTKGWIFNGSTHYLYTAFIPTTDQAQSLLIQYANLGRAATTCLAGSDSGSNADFKIVATTTATEFWNGAITGAVAQVPTSGNLAVAGPSSYIDGSPVGGTAGTWDNPATALLTIGAEMDGSANRFCPVQIQAFALYNVALSAADVATIAAAMAAL